MAQVAPLIDCSSKWPYPLESDGWYRAHDALRADLAALDAMLDAFNRQLLAGTGISREQAAAATAFYNAFVKNLHHHHHNEDGEPPPREPLELSRLHLMSTLSRRRRPPPHPILRCIH
jgi:hypothetical protein